MSLTAQMSQYETCPKCGGPVPRGLPCPACTSSAAQPLTYAPMEHGKEPQGLLVTPPPMTLRDYFAGQALAGITGNSYTPWAPDAADIEDVTIAKSCFDLADAMLEARKEQPHD